MFKFMTDFDLARQNMVLSQLQPDGVIMPAVLDAFSVVPREKFVPVAARLVAYSDAAIDLGHGHQMLPPSMLARMIDQMRPVRADRALVVGDMTGYATAIMAQICDHVVDFDAVPKANDVVQKLADMGTANVVYANGSYDAGGFAGEFDVVLIAGAVATVPHALVGSLAALGRLSVIQQPSKQNIGQAMLYIKNAQGQVAGRALFDTRTSYLTGCAPLEKFRFA
jgi:protein-L-isoaspartate(D-aspartate) O-methyltransferase